MILIDIYKMFLGKAIRSSLLHNVSEPEGVDEDAEEDEALKDVVVHEPLDVHLNGRQELPDAVEASVKPKRRKGIAFSGASRQGLHFTAKFSIRGLRIKTSRIRGLDGLNGLGKLHFLG